MVLAWLRVVRAYAAGAPKPRPALSAINAVASHRVGVANSNGKRCYVGQETIARANELSPKTVRAVDRWLEAAGFLEFVQCRPGGLKEFSLVIPAGTSTQSPHHDLGADTAPKRSDMSASDGSDQTADSTGRSGPTHPPHRSPQTHYLPQPTVREGGEETRGAALTGSPLVFDDITEDEVRRVVDQIATEANRSLERTPALLAAVTDLLGRGCAEEVVVHEGVRIVGGAKSNPETYLAGGLRRLLAGDRSLPAWCRFANAFRLASLLEDRCDVDSVADRQAVGWLELFDFIGGPVDLDEISAVRYHHNPAEQAEAAQLAEKVVENSLARLALKEFE